MATFSELQITNIAEIIGCGSNVMAQHLSFYAAQITDSDKTAVLSRVDEYQVVESDNVYVTAGPAGFQGNISPAEKRALVKTRIVALLHAEELGARSGLVRG